MRRDRCVNVALVVALVAGCSSAPQPVDDVAPPVPPAPVTTPLFAPEAKQTAKVTVKTTNTRFHTAEHLFAAIEMQVSGEPLATKMGRDVSGYKRFFLPTDVYYDPRLPIDPVLVPPRDLAGFSTAIESYEYSKQPMNLLALESGAGTSLAFAPVLNPTGVTGAAALALLRDKVRHYGEASFATDFWVTPPGDATNPLGWAGIWPTLHPFKSFDPKMNPTSDVALRCRISSDDDPGDQGLVLSADYECDYNTLHLADRKAQIESTITPGASGWAGWKYSLWVINYLQIMHDRQQTATTVVAAKDLTSVGVAGNTVLGKGDGLKAGTYIGSSDIEGFQAAMMIDTMDNQAEDWLMNLATADGATLSGFGTLKAALAYDYTSPPRWFPAEIALTEEDDASGFPRPSARTIASGESRLFDLLGLAGEFASFFALTDHRNSAIGGSQSAHVYFDGDPFPDDDQRANGDPTPHDRALSMLRVILVNVDRLHRDPASGLLVDTVSASGARSDTLSALNAAYTLVALRTVRRALTSELALYSNTKPDSPATRTPLDENPVTAPGGVLLGERLNVLLRAHADLFYDHLTDESGKAFAGWNVKTGAAISADDGLDAHTAAVRGLLTAYLATGDVKYRDRALAVFVRMERVFYDPAARMYTATPAPADDVEFGPVRFALLQAALREVYELLGARPGGESIAAHVVAHLARLNKLVLNGWDDRDENQKVDWPSECGQHDTIPRGGLQMAERSLTGETGTLDDRMISPAPRVATFDREGDCVPEIDDAHLPAALAHSIHLHVVRP